MGQPESSLGENVGFLSLKDSAAASPDVSTETWKASAGGAGAGWVEAPQLKCTAWTPPPPPGLKLEGGSLPGDAAKYMGEYRLDRGKLVNGRPAYQHVTRLTCWLAFDGAIWRGQPEADLGQTSGFLMLSDAAAATPDASAATWLAETGSGWAAQPQLKCTPCIPPPPPGLKLEYVARLELRTGDEASTWAEYMGGYRLIPGKPINGRAAYRQVTLASDTGSSLTDGSRGIAFDGANWRGFTMSQSLEKGPLMLPDTAAATPDASSVTWLIKTWLLWTPLTWVAHPQLKCIPWTPPPPPPPVLKLEGGSLPGAAVEYLGEYRLIVDDRVWPPQAGIEAAWPGGPMLVNGRPAWRHTAHLTCWLAFDGANWRGQPEADLGQKSGFLQLPDAAVFSPDASSATWLVANGPGSAWAAQPQLKCISCAAPPRSRAELSELPVKNFRGPYADRCKPLAPCCCVSADGEAIFCCVLTKPGYILPMCLHMVLCPQTGCDPKGGAMKPGAWEAWEDGPSSVNICWCWTCTYVNELCCCSQGKTVPLPGDGTCGAAPWYPLRDSNPQHLLPLGSVPAPRAPLWAPTAERPPLPLTPAPPGTLCSGSVAGSGDVAAQRAAAASRRSCEPPSDQPQEAYERRRCICGGVPQCMRPAARRARPRGEGPHVECCVLQLAG